MKKSAAIIVMTLFYLFTTCGVYIGMHYCGGNFKSLSFLPNGKSNGCCCGTKDKQRKGCCKDKAFYIKIKDNQKSASQLNPILSSERMIVFVNGFSLNLNYSFATLETLKPVYPKPPPLISSEDLYLTHRSLLI